MIISSATRNSLLEVAARAEEIAMSLTRFRDATRTLSSDRPRLIEQYPDQWVAVHAGSVIAHGDTIEHVLADVGAQGIARSDVIVRLIETNQRTLIL